MQTVERETNGVRGPVVDASRAGNGMGLRVALLFDEDPDLVEHLNPALAAAARRRVVAPVHHLCRGSWEPEREGDAGDILGLLVLDGLLVRHVDIARRRAAELVGAGDLICPRYELGAVESTLPARVSWSVVEPVRAAVIDEAVQAAVRSLPGVINELFGRAVKRAGAVTAQRVITRLPRLDARLLFLLWQLADRWGRRSADCVRLPLPLTHELLSDLASANRAAVSRALGRLSEAGLVSKHDGYWKLHGSPPIDESAAAPQVGAVAVRES
ncbi:MAG: Crp/Fnr family transcriptional regulator [Actinomycetota bacterium]|nr:Crp/Fnr family transcriptional regulator [Actinomycetota bacterium]